MDKNKSFYLTLVVVFCVVLSGLGGYFIGTHFGEKETIKNEVKKDEEKRNEEINANDIKVADLSNYVYTALYSYLKSGEKSLNSYLNNEFINTFDAVTKAKIAETTWKVGGNTWVNIGTQPAKTAYQNEIVSPVTTNTTDGATELKAKIGLMYVSDYGFAAPPSAWTTNLYDYKGEAIKSSNWMYLGADEWTISRLSEIDSRVFGIPNSGALFHNFTYYEFDVRPVFSLTSSVNYASGSGTAADPILVN